MNPSKKTPNSRTKEIGQCTFTRTPFRNGKKFRLLEFSPRS